MRGGLPRTAYFFLHVLWRVVDRQSGVRASMHPCVRAFVSLCIRESLHLCGYAYTRVSVCFCLGSKYTPNTQPDTQLLFAVCYPPRQVPELPSPAVVAADAWQPMPRQTPTPTAPGGAPFPPARPRTGRARRPITSTISATTRSALPRSAARRYPIPPAFRR